MSRVVVIGAGAMGLAAGYRALKRGHAVTVLEAAPEPGGMAAHFDLGGLSIERYYHFVCKSDHATFELLNDLGIGGCLRWTATSMGYYMDGELQRWGDPVALLKFRGLPLIDKVRYGAMMFFSTHRKDAQSLENVSAREWIVRWCGQRVYDRLWAPLFRLKFFEYADPISAAWIWTRIKRIGTSRRSVFQEELGYIDGGSETLINALMDAIVAQGGQIHLSTPAQRIEVENGRVNGVRTADRIYPADAVISTVPTPLIPRLVPDLTEAELARYAAIQNIGVVCVVFRLQRSVTPYFWVNISDPRFEIPGIVEFSNLRPVGDTIVYIPYYMPTTHPKFANGDAYFFNEGLSYLQALNPELQAGDVISYHVGRLAHAQPVCPPGFAATLPSVQTSIHGLQIADTCFYYPEDRGISESVRLGKIMAEAVGG